MVETSATVPKYHDRFVTDGTHRAGSLRNLSLKYLRHDASDTPVTKEILEQPEGSYSVVLFRQNLIDSSSGDCSTSGWEGM